jgi:hypothetical protein
VAGGEGVVSFFWLFVGLFVWGAEGNSRCGFGSWVGEVCEGDFEGEGGCCDGDGGGDFEACCDGLLGGDCRGCDPSPGVLKVLGVWSKKLGVFV